MRCAVRGLPAAPGWVSVAGSAHRHREPDVPAIVHALRALAALTGAAATYFAVATALLPLAPQAPAWAPLAAALPAMLAGAAGLWGATSPRLPLPAAAAILVATNPGLVTLLYAGGLVLVGAIGWFLVAGLALFGGALLLAWADLLRLTALWCGVSAVVVGLLRRLGRAA